MISLCQECYAVDKVDLKAMPGLSHGICLSCMPEYLRKNGVDEDSIKELVEKFKAKEVENVQIDIRREEVKSVWPDKFRI